MRILKLQKKGLFPFLEVISKEAEVWAPVAKQGGPPAETLRDPHWASLAKREKFSFERIQDFSKIALNTTRTIIPPKKIMVPSSFNMFHFSEKGYQEDLSHVTDRILFGIHPCDIHGLLTLDKLFAQAFPDPYYLEARKKTVILGLSCWPDEFCFCKSTHTDIIEEGYDLFFTDLESHFLVWIGSSRGYDLIRLTPDFFDERLTEKDIQAYIKWQEERDKAFRTSINFTRMPDLMELKYKAPFWEEAGAACLACGSCTMVCPTCNCYNVVDQQFLDNRPGRRLRYWDSCTLPEYSEVAGGENFREHKSQRLRLWYTHKLQAYVSKYGKPSCVGCGRCLVTCPVQINVQSVADALEGQPVDAFWKKFAGEVSK
ncbi:MAG: 4Fe-4S dicluster domain-containing protein [Candidatus Aminicenantales bacterium]